MCQKIRTNLNNREAGGQKWTSIIIDVSMGKSSFSDHRLEDTWPGITQTWGGTSSDLAVGQQGWVVMMSGVGCDWLRKEWLRGIWGDKGPPSQFPSIFLNLYTLVIMTFGTNNSNLMAASLFPCVLSTYPHSLFQLDNYVGTISQLENQCFEQLYNLSVSEPLCTLCLLDFNHRRGSAGMA